MITFYWLLDDWLQFVKNLYTCILVHTYAYTSTFSHIFFPHFKPNMHFCLRFFFVVFVCRFHFYQMVCILLKSKKDNTTNMKVLRLHIIPISIFLVPIVILIFCMLLVFVVFLGLLLGFIKSNKCLLMTRDHFHAKIQKKKNLNIKLKIRVPWDRQADGRTDGGTDRHTHTDRLWYVMFHFAGWFVFISRIGMCHLLLSTKIHHIKAATILKILLTFKTFFFFEANKNVKAFQEIIILTMIQGKTN